MVKRLTPLQALGAAVAVGVLLAGCVSTAQNVINPTATEQLLVAHAAERAAAGLNLRLTRGAKIYLDFGAIAAQRAGANALAPMQMFTPNDRYVIAAVKAHLQGRGLILSSTADAADIVIALRISADSLDDLNRVLGVPALAIPSMSQNMPAVNLPELSIWSEHQRAGIVEISATAVDAHTGELIAAVGPIFGTAKIVNRHLLTGFLFGNELERPGIRAGVE